MLIDFIKRRPRLAWWVTQFIYRVTKPKYAVYRKNLMIGRFPTEASAEAHILKLFHQADLHASKSKLYSSTRESVRRRQFRTFFKVVKIND